VCPPLRPGRWGIEALSITQQAEILRDISVRSFFFRRLLKLVFQVGGDAGLANRGAGIGRRKKEGKSGPPVRPSSAIKRFFVKKEKNKEVVGGVVNPSREKTNIPRGQASRVERMSNKP